MASELDTHASRPSFSAEIAERMKTIIQIDSYFSRTTAADKMQLKN
jgi:hypothetical protein